MLAALSLSAAQSASAADGAWERAWGEDVISTGMAGDLGLGAEVCTVVSACKTGVTTAPALGGEFNNAAGVAADAAGNVYVADYNHNRIQKFNPSGAFERAWGQDVVSAGPGNTGSGFEICVAANGDTCKIGVVNSPALGGELNRPVDIAIDAAGNVYVSDSFHDRVQKFSPAGVFERAWGEDVTSAGPGNTGGFEICVAANGDTCKIGTFGSPALGGELNSPTGVAADAGGGVFVVDYGHARIQKYSSGGTFERAWGEEVVSAGPGNTGGFEICVPANGDTCKTGMTDSPALGGEIANPTGVATDTAGSVYVADSAYNRIQKYSSLGVFERAWGEEVVSGGPGNTGGPEICVAANGDTCQAGGTTEPALGGEMEFPTGVAADAAGNVYVADFGHDRVQRFSSLGVFQRAWGEDVASAGPGNTGSGFEICVATSGDTCKAGITTAPALGGDLNGPQYLATDPAGNLYVTEQNHHRVQRYGTPLAGPGGGGGGGSPNTTAPKPKKCKKKKKKGKKGAGAAKKRCKKKKKKK